jgi:predicted AAA+ superfamily ATPase
MALSFKRYLTKVIQADLTKKMVFVGGPRQVGKTTLGKSFLPDSRGYLNWDIDEHRENILSRELPPVPFLFFDEIHKYRSWRNFLKGVYDGRDDSRRILVTGSARLDYYRFGGDSLQGRYHYHRLHPLSVAELGSSNPSDLLTLHRLGGFPEPFFSGSDIDARRWSREFRQRFIREDLQGVEQVEDLGKLELLMLRLPDLVGSPLSINSLREEIQTSHKTLSRWLQIFERLYAIFRLPPFGPPKIRAVKKEQKHYHYDWSLIPEEGPRFENLVASHLAKWVDFEVDSKGRDLELRYFRDVEGREVDFVVLEKRQPSYFIEAKWNDVPLDSSLKYLKTKYPNVEAWQLSAVGKKDYQTPEGIRVAPAGTFLKHLV